MLAVDLIRAVEQAGGHLEPDGDGLVVEAPAPLPEPIMAELRARKAEVLAALADQADLLRRAHLAVVPDLGDPEDVRTWLHERAAMREDSGTARADADKAAFDELLWLWCAANPIEHAPGRCAACAVPLSAPVMALPDGAQVCDKPDHACLIAHGNSRRTAAVDALGGVGIEPPAWWEL
jgi:hypothetical protein